MAKTPANFFDVNSDPESSSAQAQALNLRIYSEIRGAIDIHCHTDPDCVPRLLTDREALAQAKAVGMRAIMMKCHTSQSAARAAALNETLGPDIDVFGLICLNPALGGINPEAVKYAIQMGVKGVWMPSMWADNNVRYVKEMHQYLREEKGFTDEQLRLQGKMGDESIGTIFGDEGVKVVTETGEIKPELIEIMEMVADADIMLATGHVSCEHAHMILDAANEVGVKKLVVHTCNYHTMNYPLEDLHQMVVKNGAYLEMGFSSLPNPIWMPVKMERLWDLDRIARAIRLVGPGHCILSTDSGQLTTASPIECVRMWGELLKTKGFSQAEIDLMTKVNPATVLGIDPGPTAEVITSSRSQPGATSDEGDRSPRNWFMNPENIRDVSRYEYPWDALNLRTYETIVGTVDLSVHTAPDVYPRLLTDREAVAQADAIGMRALLLKNHISMTADRASGVKELLGAEVEVFGGICLNGPVGGLNPDAVEHAINMGIRCVWMPTFWAQDFVDRMNKRGHLMGYETLGIEVPENGITLLDSNGALVPAVIDILKMVADADLLLATGNISVEETMRLFEKASELGIQKLLVSNANDVFPRYRLEDLAALVKQTGAYLELSHRAMPYPLWWEGSEPGERLETIDDVCEIIRTIGAEHCIVSSDSGQLTSATPIECMRMWPELLKVRKISRADVDTMIRRNPAALLGLPAEPDMQSKERPRRTIDDVIEEGIKRV